jgi:pimeloyl-ACP methyl ester carboxylesterase
MTGGAKVMNNTVGFAKINGAKLYYEVTGRGSPVALIHGFTLDRRMWDDQVAALALRHQVVRYDLRGFGRSSLPSNAYSHVDDLQTLLNYLGIDRVALLGLSMGGAIALDFACAYPERLRAMLLADSTLRGFS